MKKKEKLWLLALFLFAVAIPISLETYDWYKSKPEQGWTSPGVVDSTTWNSGTKTFPDTVKLK